MIQKALAFRQGPVRPLTGPSRLRLHKPQRKLKIFAERIQRLFDSTSSGVNVEVSAIHQNIAVFRSKNDAHAFHAITPKSSDFRRRKTAHSKAEPVVLQWVWRGRNSSPICRRKLRISIVYKLQKSEKKWNFMTQACIYNRVARPKSLAMTGYASQSRMVGQGT